MSHPLRAYREHSHAQEQSLNGYTVVKILIDSCVERLHQAQGAAEHGHVAQRGEAISVAIDILGGLQMSLDMEKGGDIAIQLDRLYDYMQRALLQANLKNDASKIAHVIGLIKNIQEAWDAIPEPMRVPKA